MSMDWKSYGMFESERQYLIWRALSTARVAASYSLCRDHKPHLLVRSHDLMTQHGVLEKIFALSDDELRELNSRWEPLDTETLAKELF